MTSVAEGRIDHGLVVEWIRERMRPLDELVEWAVLGRNPLNDGSGWSMIVTPKRKDCD